MIKRHLMSLLLVLLAPGFVATAQDRPGAFPPDVAAEIQAAG